jgi:hypothetical protein
MKTTLTSEQLARIHAEHVNHRDQFIDPRHGHRLERLIGERGEEWVGSVLLRSTERRGGSMFSAHLPFVSETEMHMLFAAEQVELDSLAERMSR